MLILVQGCAPASAKAAINSAITFAAFEQECKLLFLSTAIQSLADSEVAQQAQELTNINRKAIFVEAEPLQGHDINSSPPIPVNAISRDSIQQLMRSAKFITSY